MFRFGEDFVEIDGDAEGDEKEAAGATTKPIWWGQRGRSGELGEERVGAIGEKEGGWRTRRRRHRLSFSGLDIREEGSHLGLGGF